MKWITDNLYRHTVFKRFLINANIISLNFGSNAAWSSIAIFKGASCKVCSSGWLFACFCLNYIVEEKKYFKHSSPALVHTVTDDHAGLQRFICKGFVADAAGSLVDIEEAANTVAGTMKVVQSWLPQGRTGKRIQEVAWKRHGDLQLKTDPLFCK